MDNIIQAIAKSAKEHILSVVLGSVYLLILAFLGLSDSELKQTLMRYFTAPKNYKTMLLIGAFVAYSPCLIGGFNEFFGKRSKAIKYGCALLYRHQDRLTFAEIAQKWILPENSSYTEDGIITWLVSDMWMGAFENRNGGTSLCFQDKKIEDIRPTREYLLGSSFAFLDTGQQTKSNPKNIRFPFDSSLSKRKKKEQLDLIDWQYLASLDVDSYKRSKIATMYAKDGEMYLRAYIDKLAVTRKAFIKWLRRCNNPLPERWYAKT